MSACNGSCTCGCCAGITAATPATIDNRAGLSAVAYRIGVHSSFKRSMLAALSGAPERRLTTRDDDDFSIALLDAWAVTSDVLTFYQERIANESYLRTARERLSVVELARLIGYEPAPAVAAVTWLAFNLEKGAPETVVIDPGTRVQSVPGQNEQAQTFETVAPLRAKLEWSDVAVRTHAPQSPSPGDTMAYLQGADLALRRGDALLFRSAGGEGELRRLTDVAPDFDNKRTKVAWSGGLARAAAHLYAMRVVTGLFGHNAPQQLLINGKSGEWPFSTSPLLISGAHPSISPGTFVVLQKAGTAPLFYEVTAADEISASDYAISGEATKVTLTPNSGFPDSNAYRGTRVFAGSEELALADAPLTSAVSGKEIALAGAIAAPEAGRAIIVADAAGAELARIASVTTSGGITTLHLQDDLSRNYARLTARIRLNVAPATHGESVRQLLGNGDATKPFQRFDLSRAPLTYLIDATAPRGAKSTLSVRVNDVEWRETETLFAVDSHRRVFATSRDSEEKTTVLFGDGKGTGPRLPSGSNNVRAQYRVGAGIAGNVGPNKLTTLLTRPLGVKDVTNPAAAEGGADGEVLADARRKAPRTILTIDRVVSLRDYESFAAAFSGIGKALATWAWSGTHREVVVTIAGALGETFGPTNVTRLALAGALRRAGDPFVPLRVVSYRKAELRVVARVRVEADRDATLVLDAVRSAVEASFSFAARGFGQAVALSEVVAVMQNVPGVLFVDLDLLHRTTLSPSRQERIAPQPAAGNVGAELVTISQLVLTGSAS